jgi:hypothetical protein
MDARVNPAHDALLGVSLNIADKPGHDVAKSVLRS